MDAKPLNIKLLYIVSISAILAILFVHQLIIQLSIKNQSLDATLINLAGKERMFSQNVAKTSLLLLQNKDIPEELKIQTGILNGLITDWKIIHVGLQRADGEFKLKGPVNDKIVDLYEEIDPFYQKIINAATQLVENSGQINLQRTVDTILSNEKSFLVTMDKIVSEYEMEARGKVTRLVVTEISLTILLFLILLFEITFIFRPAYNTIRAANVNLMAVNEKLKKTNRSLSLNREKLKETERIGKIGSWEWNIPANKIYWSDEIFKIFDISPHQFDRSYEAYLDLIHPEDQAGVDALVKRAIKEKSPLQIEHRILNAKGEIKYVKGNGSLTMDKLGNAVKVKGVVQEVTDQKIATDSLRRKEEDLREAERIGKIGSWELHILSDTLLCSGEFLRIFQLRKEQPNLTTNDMLERIHPEDKARVRKAIDDSFRKRIPFHVEYRLLIEPDVIKYIAARAETSFDRKGNPLVMRGVVLDITDRKEHERMSLMIQQKQNEFEKQQEKMKSLAILEGEEKERMRFSMELHDGVGQILTALKINVKILSEQDLENEREYYWEILKDVKELVNSATFEIRRISNNLTPKLLMDFGLTEGIDNLINILLERADIKITKKIALGKKRYKEQVEISLFRIMQEVLQNIIKHAQAGHVSITLRENNGCIELKVTDDGKGFDISTIKNRSSKSSGLTNLKHRIDLLNGHLYIKSVIGGGCEILVNIPLN